MNVLVGHFTTESNAHIPLLNNLSNYELFYGQDVIDKMRIRDVFEQANIHLIPALYAGGGPSGVIEKETFLSIEQIFLSTIKKNLDRIDGIYLWLHGASYVEEIGSGDHHILKEIRKLVGPYLPIAVSCDPHGNCTKEYVESLQIIRSFRQSPHTDMIETYHHVAKMLCKLLHSRENIHCIYRKLPLILGGEQSVSTDEPVLSINQFMEKLELDSRIMSVSWHVGYLRHDCPEAGCGVVVVPMTQADQSYAEIVANQLADFVWQRRHDFHYTGLTAQPNEALEMAIKFKGKPFVITDSGDNTTSGATGWNTGVLSQVLTYANLKKTVLFAGICDPKTYTQLITGKQQQEKLIELGNNADELSKSIPLTIQIKAKGKMVRLAALGQDDYIEIGECILVSIKGKPIDIIITNHRQAYCHSIQFQKAGVKNWSDYDLVVVKQGYIFPELKQKAAGYVMSLTDGSTPQDTKNSVFKRIMRPMYPIDDI